MHVPRLARKSCKLSGRVQFSSSPRNTGNVGSIPTEPLGVSSLTGKTLVPWEGSLMVKTPGGCWDDASSNLVFSTKYGDVAQLGEHLSGRQKVAGSNPAISTKITHSKSQKVKETTENCFETIRCVTIKM